MIVLQHVCFPAGVGGLAAGGGNYAMDVRSGELDGYVM